MTGRTTHIPLSPIRRPAAAAGASLLALVLAVPALAQTDAAFEVETVAEGLEHPWGMAFLPDDTRMLVTERTGSLLLVDREGGETEEISGAPEVVAEGQGGLLDVALHPDFENEPWVYMTWAGPVGDGMSTTHFGRAELDLDAMELGEVETLYVAEPWDDPGQGHYGSRIAFDGEGHVFFTTGDRQSKDFGPDHVSQDTTNSLGNNIRLALDGSIPEDNPFVGDDSVLDEIWSYGHRNVQAMAFHPQTGALWQAEHGEFNGDEINVIEEGGNYGWPIATYGVDYQTQETFAPTPPEVPETIEPVFFWEPDDPEGFPPSGFAFYDADAFPDWQGSAFIGNLAHEYLGRFVIDGEDVQQAERLLEGEGWRIRDVAVGPDDGFLYVLVDDADAPLVRLRPADG
jgi:aldose sugar dehydrogenase